MSKLLPPVKVVYQVAFVPRGQVALSVTGVLPKQGMFSVVFVNVAFSGFIEVVVILEFTVAKLVPLTEAIFVTAHVFAGNTFAALIVALKVIMVVFPAGKVNGPTEIVSAVALAELFLADWLVLRSAIFWISAIGVVCSSTFLGAAIFDADALLGTRTIPDSIVPPPCSSIAVPEPVLLFAFQKVVKAADLSPVPFK